jgi:hypothetical protein
LLVGVAAAAFAATYAGVQFGAGFDAWKRLRDILRYSDNFNRIVERPYVPWLAGNLKEVTLAIGPAVCVSALAALGHAAWKVCRAMRTGAPSAFLDPGVTLTVSTAAVLAIDVLLGQNRSEVPRLWIVYFAAIQVVAAWWCVEQGGNASRRLVVAGTFAYAAVTVATVGYVVP